MLMLVLLLAAIAVLPIPLQLPMPYNIVSMPLPLLLLLPKPMLLYYCLLPLPLPPPPRAHIGAHAACACCADRHVRVYTQRGEFYQSLCSPSTEHRALCSSSTEHSVSKVLGARCGREYTSPATAPRLRHRGAAPALEASWAPCKPRSFPVSELTLTRASACTQKALGTHGRGSRGAQNISAVYLQFNTLGFCFLYLRAAAEAPCEEPWRKPRVAHFLTLRIVSGYTGSEAY